MGAWRSKYLLRRYDWRCRAKSQAESRRSQRPQNPQKHRSPNAWVSGRQSGVVNGQPLTLTSVWTTCCSGGGIRCSCSLHHITESEQMTMFGLAVTCSRLLRQPPVTQASKLQHCTLSSLCQNGKISSSLALQKFGIYSRKSLGLFHDFSARSSGEHRNFFAEQHC